MPVQKALGIPHYDRTQAEATFTDWVQTETSCNFRAAASRASV
jgi:hypothetical protein